MQLPLLIRSHDKIFIAKQLDLLQSKISACTVAGRKATHTPVKPNEDAFSVTQQDDIVIAAVFDGTSSLKPIKALGEETGARFASHFLKSELENNITETIPNDIIRKLNKALLHRTLQFEGARLEDTHTLPASTATIISLDLHNQEVKLSHVGDSYCIIFHHNGNSDFVTIDKNREYDDKMFELMHKVAKERGISPREARQDDRVKHALLDMFQDSHNRADGTGQGLINGDPYAEQYIQDIIIPMTSISAILLASDGLIPPGFDEQKEEDRKKIKEIIIQGGLEKLVQMKQEVEDSDPNWNLIRYKHSDDATGVFIQIA